MKTSRTITDKYALLRVEGSLTNENIQQLSDELSGVVSDRDHVILDFTEVTFVCSATLGMLLRFNQAAAHSNRCFLIYGVHEDIMKIFTITEVAHYLSLFETQKEALDYLESRISRS
jgi:anti-anti-sigma factor